MRLETVQISADSPGWLDQALGVLRAGGLVAFPTDTVYGVGTRASEARAVKRIFEAKGRPGEKAIPVLVASWEAAGVLVIPTSGAARLAAAYWPGPLTLVVNSRADLPGVVGSDGTIGVRSPDHPVALSLLRAAGALAATSANRSGAEDPRTADDVMAGLSGRIELVIDGGECPGGLPSTVVDCTGEVPVLLREGPVGLQQILEAWGEGP